MEFLVKPQPSTVFSLCTVQFTLVDAALAPFFLRMPVLKHYRGFDLPPVRAPKYCTVVTLRVLGVCIPLSFSSLVPKLACFAVLVF